ncbi:MAG TPA: hypothetical protein VMU84_22005, partial [Thermoanaerobaculia bacterium]|nr:hypothetical protein [Thermoanaerobaculia bacterium]
VLASSAKLSPALLNDPDETAEVASPAQESQNALCLPYMNTPQYATCLSNFGLVNGVTASQVFPSNIQNPRIPVGPRVFDRSKNIVFFEVRVNYDYFQYVLSNGSNAAPNPPTSTQPPYELLWRTSAPSGAGGPNLGKTGYNAKSTAQTYGTASLTPPPVGSIQVKAAWQLLPGDPGTNAPYHTTQAVHFNTSAQSPGGICYQVDYFALIALHIIQRVHTGDTNSTSGAEPYGGTFIFATWELNSIRDTGGYTYVNFAAQGGADQTNPTPYPPVANALPVTTLGPDPSPLPSTIGVTNAVYGILPANSVWRNYRLIGTQFIPTTHTQSLAYNQPYYLANLVVETNRGLQNFQGLPRNITVNSKYTSNQTFPAANATAYDPSKPNVAFQNQSTAPVDMGGCMGCHGVAQLLGTSFSFVLFDGLRGAGIDTPTQVAIPPNPPPGP